MEKKKHHDEMLRRASGSTELGKDEALIREVENLNLDVSQEIMQRTESDVAQSEEQTEISMDGLTKTLMSVAPEYKGRMRLSVTSACLREIFSFATYFFSAYVTTWLIERAGDNSIGFDELLQYAFLATGLLLFYFVLTGLDTVISYKTFFSISEKLRQTLSEKLKVIPMRYLVGNPVEGIKVVIMNRVADTEGWIAHLMPELPSRLSHPILYVIILFYLGWCIGLSIFVPLPAVLIGMAAVIRKYRSGMVVWLSSCINVTDRGAEYVREIPVIKVFTQDRASYGKFADAVKFYRFSTMKWWKQSWLGKVSVTAAMMTPQIVGMPFTFYLHGEEEIGMEILLLLLTLLISTLPQTLTITISFELLQMASNTWVSIQELLDIPVQKRLDADKRVAIDDTRGIKFTNVSFFYHDGTEVLHKISFKTKPGEVTALVNPSGGGESTITELLAGFWDPTLSMASFSGMDTRKTPSHQSAEEISLISQDNFLFDVSIGDNIRLGKPDAGENEIIRAAKAARYHELIMALPGGYETKAGVTGDTMSGDERQRITLAKAILKPASTIILDEVTAYANPEDEAPIQEVISHLVKGKNLVVVVHRLNTIKQVHQVILTDKGQIIAKGRYDELL